MKKILILGNASLLNTIAHVLAPTKKQFDLQYATLAEFNTAVTSIDLILYDAKLGQNVLSEAINFLSASNFQIPLIVIEGEPSIDAAVVAIKAGATDYIASNATANLPKAIERAIEEPFSIFLESQCIAQTERQLLKLISQNADGIIVVDRQGIVQFVNPAGLKLLGKSSAELIGESVGFPVVNGDYLEVDILVDGEIIVAQMRVNQIQWQKEDAYVVSLRDITRLKRAEEERAELLKEAQAANRAKDEFLAILSHELRTPLNPIVGWSQLLLKGSLSEAQIQKGAEIIHRNAMLQTQLISDILDISRIIRGKLKLEAESIDLVDVINNAIDTVELAAKAKSISIETNLNENIGLVRGDSTRLQQVIWNLLTNAVKFSHNGGKIEINLTLVDTPIQQNNSQTKLSSPYAHIQIIDWGKGIEPQFLPYVFDYFRQEKSTKSRSEGGLGLGLAIVRRLVELHGGEVNAASSGVNEGATFTMSLPILRESIESSFDKPYQDAKSLHNIRIQIVEDDEHSRDMLVLVLEQEAAKVKVTTSAIEALSVIEEFQPDILISDIGMPDIDGYEFIQKVRKLPSAAKNVKAIALSGYASDGDRQDSLAAGFDSHISKPLDIYSLIDAVIKLVKQ